MKLHYFEVSIVITAVFLLLVFLLLYLAERRKKRKVEIKYEALDREYAETAGKCMSYQMKYKTLNEAYIREKDQSEEIQRLHEKARTLKHDMKNHFLAITSYLNANQCQEAKDYISTILDRLNQIYTYIETGNSILNNIINTKLEYAKQRGIAIKAEIENLPFETMGSVDFSSLFGNLLDNAIEASAMSPNKEIHLNILKKRGYDTILIKNRIEESVLKKNPQLKSTKKSKEKHGFGIRQVKSIVEKYNGMIDFYEEDGMFCVYFMVPSEKKE